MVDRPRAIHLDLLPLASPLQVESLSTLSHELRTPLNVILGFAEMLEDPECDEAQRGQLLHRIKAAAAGLVELVDRALAAAEAEVACPVPRPIESHDPSQGHAEAPNGW